MLAGPIAGSAQSLDSLNLAYQVHFDHRNRILWPSQSRQDYVPHSCACITVRLQEEPRKAQIVHRFLHKLLQSSRSLLLLPTSPLLQEAAYAAVLGPCGLRAPILNGRVRHLARRAALLIPARAGLLHLLFLLILIRFVVYREVHHASAGGSRAAAAPPYCGCWRTQCCGRSSRHGRTPAMAPSRQHTAGLTSPLQQLPSIGCPSRSLLVIATAAAAQGAPFGLFRWPAILGPVSLAPLALPRLLHGLPPLLLRLLQLRPPLLHLLPPPVLLLHLRQDSLLLAHVHRRQVHSAHGGGGSSSGTACVASRSSRVRSKRVAGFNLDPRGLGCARQVHIQPARAASGSDTVKVSAFIPVKQTPARSSRKASVNSLQPILRGRAGRTKPIKKPCLPARCRVAHLLRSVLRSIRCAKRSTSERRCAGVAALTVGTTRCGRS